VLNRNAKVRLLRLRGNPPGRPSGKPPAPGAPGGPAGHAGQARADHRARSACRADPPPRLPLLLLALLAGRPMPIAPMRFIIFCISPNCLTRLLTSVTEVPLPSAMRLRRLPLMISGLRRSSGRHRADDRLDRLQLVVADLGALQLLRHAGHHADEVAERAHLLQLLHLLEEVVEGELALQQRLAAASASFSKACSALLDEGEHVAHAEDAAGHAVGVEELELVELLAGRREGDRACR
jgi:hypothetical protein